jgi:hypothetical protein
MKNETPDLDYLVSELCCRMSDVEALSLGELEKHRRELEVVAQLLRRVIPDRC